MKDLYEIGIVFRGFVIVSHTFKDLPVKDENGVQKDLRGAFISAISSFAETAFVNNSLEYLESSNTLFIFKMSKITSCDNSREEALIVYGLIEKRKKPDKVTKKFLDKVQPIIQEFKLRYDGKDFTELGQFESFKNEIKGYFLS